MGRVVRVGLLAIKTSNLRKMISDWTPNCFRKGRNEMSNLAGLSFVPG